MNGHVNRGQIRAKLVAGATFVARSREGEAFCRVEERTVEDDGVSLRILQTDGVTTRRRSCGLTWAANTATRFCTADEFESALAAAEAHRAKAAEEYRLMRKASYRQAVEPPQHIRLVEPVPSQGEVAALARRVVQLELEVERLRMPRSVHMRLPQEFVDRMERVERELQRLETAWDWFRHRKAGE